MEAMDYLVYIAIAVGGFVSFLRLFIDDKLDELMIVVGCLPFRSRRKFDELYEFIDNDFMHDYFIKVINSKQIKTYSDYSKLREKAQPTMYERFVRYQNEFSKDLLLRVASIILLPAVVFWAYWYYYLLGAVAVTVTMAFYKGFVHEEGLGYYQYLILSLSFRDYLNNSEKTK